jgi:periplasmic protein CpxP/Spy
MNQIKRVWNIKKVRTLGLALILAAAVAVPIAIAQSSADGPGFGAGHRGHRGHFRGQMWSRRDAGFGFAKLNLTDEQKAQMKQIRDSHRDSVQALSQQVRTARQAIHQSMSGGTFDEALATQKLTEVAGIEAKLMGERFKIHQEMLSVLTPDQKAQLDQAREQFKTRMAERKARRSQKQQQQ